MNRVFYKGRWYRVYRKTGVYCRRCGHLVYPSDVTGYSYQCFYCDEDLYSFEVMRKDRRYLPAVRMVGAEDGIVTEIESGKEI